MSPPSRSWVTAVPVLALPRVTPPVPAAVADPSCRLPDSTTVPPVNESAPFRTTRFPAAAAEVPPPPPRTSSPPEPLIPPPPNAYHQSDVPFVGTWRIVWRLT